MFEQLIKLLTIGDITFLSGVGIVVVMSLVQAFSSKKPWTYILNNAGKAMNADLEAKIMNVEALEKADQEHDIGRIMALEEKQEKFYDFYRESDAKDARRRILRFADELRAKQKHSEEFFNDILDDVSTYERYCKDHPKFENKRATAAINMITETYNICLREDSFL